MRLAAASALSVLLVGAFLSARAEAAPADAPLRWRQAIGGKIIGRPVAQAESVVVVCEDRSARSYGRSGAPLWRFEAGGRLGPHLSRSPEGTSYITRTDGTFIAVNRSGRELWRVKLDSPAAAPAVVGYDGRVFILSERSLSCRSAAGFLKWSRPVAARPSTGAVLDSAGGVIVGFEDGTVLRASAFGETTTFSVSAAPVAVADHRSEKGNRIIVGLKDGRIVMENPETGAALLLASESAPAAAAAVRDGKLGSVLQNGTTLLIDIDSATVLWRGKTRESSSWALRFDERGLYALGEAGAAGFAQDGRRLWNLELDGASAPPSFSDEGVLYSGGNDWILYAYQVEDRVRAKTDALFAFGESGSYGLGERAERRDAEAEEEVSADPYELEERAVEERLSYIAEAAEINEIGEQEPEFAAFLRKAAGAERSPVRKRELPAVLPHHRARAAELLGLLGSREALPFLTDVFRRDPEAVVRAAAAGAIGAIGSDPYGDALGVFALAILPPEPVRDERLLASIAAAVGALCRFSGPPLSDQGVRLLVALSAGDKPSVVRNRARLELESLSPRDFNGK